MGTDSRMEMTGVSQWDIFNRLADACDAAGVELKLKNGSTGHYHIMGPILVNYYPFSPKRTAYAQGTTKGTPHTPEEAVALSVNGPPLAPDHLKHERNNNSRKIRMRMLGPTGLGKCCWCGCKIDIETSSIEHVVPLDRGGMEHHSNRKLACRPCNEARGNDMPELKGTPPWA